MSYPYSGADLAALTRLLSFYNGNAYNAGTNPGGMAAGGHRTNFIPSLQDLALVGAAVEDAADASAVSATASAASAVTSAAAASALGGTSTTSVAIGTGAKSFTTQTGKSFNVGTFASIVSDANPTTHYMAGQITAYNSGTGALSINATVTGGSGSRADWSIYGRAGSPGVMGTTGATGATGNMPALQWAFGNGTADSDPGNGIFLINNATYSAATFLYFDNLDFNGATQTTFLDSFDDSTNTANRGELFLLQVGATVAYARFTITGAVIDGTGYRKVPVAFVSSNGAAFTNGVAVGVTFTRTGDRGADGAGAGDTISDIATVTDGRLVIYNGTSGKHITNASFGIGTSGTNIGALNGNNTYSGTSSFTAAVAMSSALIITASIANAFALGPNGSTNPALAVHSGASVAAGIAISGAAAGSSPSIAVTSSGTNEGLLIDTKGTGTLVLNNTGTGNVTTPRVLISTNATEATTGGAGSILASGGIYATKAIISASATAASSISTGALVISGGAGIGGALFVGGVLNVAGAATLTGTATNDSAALGKIGEFNASALPYGSATSLTTGTPKDLTTLSLTAGDWDVWGLVGIDGGATTVLQYCIGAISASAAGLGTIGENQASLAFGTAGVVPFTQYPQQMAIAPFRVSLAGTTTYHLVAQAGFTTSTCVAFGTIWARRRR